MLKVFLLTIFTASVSQISQAQSEAKADCWVHDGIQRCPASSTTNPLDTMHTPSDPSITQSGSAIPYVMAPGQGDANNGCPMCKSGDANNPLDSYTNWVPGMGNSGSGTQATGQAVGQ